MAIKINTATNLTRTLPFLTLLHTMNDGYQATLPLLLPYISKEITLSLSQIGFLGAMLTVLSIVLAIPASHIGIRFGHFRVLIFAVLLYALGYIGITFSPTFITQQPRFFPSVT